MYHIEPQLTPLIDSLREMVTILSLDRDSPWLHVFSLFLEKAESLQARGCTDGELALLLSSIIELYSPDRGFTCYAPLELNPVTCGYWYIPGAENFDVVSFRIYTITERMFSESDKALKI